MLKMTGAAELSIRLLSNHITYRCKELFVAPRHLQLLKRLEEPCYPHVAAVLRQGGKDVAVPFLPLPAGE